MEQELKSSTHLPATEPNTANTIESKQSSTSEKVSSAETHQGLLVETEIILAFLRADADAWILRRALASSICYTGVLQCTEVLAEARNDAQKSAAMKVLSLMRPLGLPPRYAITVAEYLRILSAMDCDVPLRIAITAAISSFSKLPVLSIRFKSVYSRLDIPTITPDSDRL